MKLIVMILCAAATALAQTTESRMPVTDAEKIADTLLAGPLFVTKDATLARLAVDARRRISRSS